MAPFAEHVQEISAFFNRVDQHLISIPDGVKEYRRIENSIMSAWIRGDISAHGKETLLDILREWKNPNGKEELKC